MQTLEQRIGNLERSNRRLRYIAGALALGVAATIGLGMAQDAKIVPLIRAKKIEIVSDSGATMVTLNSQERNGNGIVAVMNLRGQEIVRLGATESGAGQVRTGTSSGKDLCKLTAESGNGVVMAMDSSGKKNPGRLQPQ